jgi:hypothetical protein
MRLLQANALLLSLSAAWAPAAVADQPLLRPSRDVDVTYRAFAPQGGTDIQERVRWLAAAQTMRIDPPSPGVHVIIDHVAKRMSVISDATRSVVETAAPASADPTGGKAGSFTRRGSATVASHACTEWQTRAEAGGTVLVCITDDGVLLRAGTPEHVRVTAVSVQYTPQDPAAFRAPPDYARQEPAR